MTNMIVGRIDEKRGEKSMKGHGVPLAEEMTINEKHQ